MPSTLPRTGLVNDGQSRCSGPCVHSARTTSWGPGSGSIQTRDAPDLTTVRAKIKARDWSGAVVELNGMIDKGVQHADVYNLLGFSLRNQGDTSTAQTYYQKALEFDAEVSDARVWPRVARAAQRCGVRIV